MINLVPESHFSSQKSLPLSEFLVSDSLRFVLAIFELLSFELPSFELTSRCRVDSSFNANWRRAQNSCQKNVNNERGL